MMDGKSLLAYGIEALGGVADSDIKFFYDCLDAAASDFVRQTRCLTKETTITMVADQQAYTLPPDFLGLYVQNKTGRFVGKFYDGTDHSWPKLTSYEKLYLENETDSQTHPDTFAITDEQEKDSLTTGAATAEGENAHGEVVLTDFAASYLATVSSRDIIHNHDDQSDGVVLSVTDDTHLKCALFNGSDNDFSGGDSYTIIPAPRQRVVLDAPSQVSGYTLTLPYICMLSPVYSDFGFWRLPARTCRAICYEAAYLFKVDYDYDQKRDEHLRGLFMEEIIKFNRETAQKRLQGERYKTR